MNTIEFFEQTWFRPGVGIDAARRDPIVSPNREMPVFLNMTLLKLFFQKSEEFFKSSIHNPRAILRH